MTNTKVTIEKLKTPWRLPPIARRICTSHSTLTCSASEQLSGVEAALLQHVGGMHVETLEPRGIGDHPLSDPAEPPDDKPAAATDCQQGDGGSDEDGDHLRQDCLQPPLQRPDESDDE